MVITCNVVLLQLISFLVYTHYNTFPLLHTHTHMHTIASIHTGAHTCTHNSFDNFANNYYKVKISQLLIYTENSTACEAVIKFVCKLQNFSGKLCS